MSSPAQTDEDEVEEKEEEEEEEVEFVSEDPVKPVLECIDLLSDSEDEGCSSFAGGPEDDISRQKARVTSTLDRLANRVEREKKERADKCRAFKEKQMLQKAHGQQELAFNSANAVGQEAKRCVDMWLNMSVGPGSGRRRNTPAFIPRISSTRHVCPVTNCGRVFDHTSLLAGHLKRFDHSPCDPTIHLKGSPPELFACVACGLHFQTKEAWKNHLELQVSSSTSDAHSVTQTYQPIAGFACPACYFLFNCQNDCLQHMSARNHFAETLPMNESGARPQPVAVPQYVKNRLVALCKEVGFNVRCSLCHKVLMSHQIAQAHFNVHCRQGCAVVKGDKTIAQVMKQLQVQGQCLVCCKMFFSQAELERHKESTQHDVEINQTMERALLQHCRFGKGQVTRWAEGSHRETGLQTPAHKRTRVKSDCENFTGKRQRLDQSVSGSTETAWSCECGLSFSEEVAAKHHVLAANQIFHLCGVCGKRMMESSITRLHMSRMHGGAHLSNFLFFCRKCKVEMPRYEDILSHVSQAHSGHTYYSEQEVSREVAKVIEAKASTSYDVSVSSSFKSVVQQNTVEPSSLKAEPTWMCRMCEDIFDSKAAAQKHCSDLSSHSFQRFICGHCPQKFFKESTVRRHCVNEHDGKIQSSHFCGLCDSMQFESEKEFLEHYNSLHSKDYFCIDDVDAVQPAVAERASRRTCPCMSSEKSTKKMKATYTQCMRNLAAEGKCRYACAPCGVRTSSYAQMKTHVHTKHDALNLDKTFEIECKACPETFESVPNFHDHYHGQHCTLEPCVSSWTCGKDVKEAATSDAPDAVEMNAENYGDSDEEMKQEPSVVEEEEEDVGESAEMEEALKRSLLEF